MGDAVNNNLYRYMTYHYTRTDVPIVFYLNRFCYRTYVFRRTQRTKYNNA